MRLDFLFLDSDRKEVAHDGTNYGREHRDCRLDQMPGEVALVRMCESRK
jgi:hypothetical protein